MFGEQLAHRTHELAPRVNLKELRSPQGAPSQAIGDLCRSLTTQGLSLLVAAGDVNDSESVAEGFPSYAVVWQKEQIRLVALVRRGDVEFWSWYVPWGRAVDLPDACFLSQSLACCSVTFAVAERFLIAASPFQ